MREIDRYWGQAETRPKRTLRPYEVARTYPQCSPQCYCSKIHNVLPKYVLMVLQSVSNLAKGLALLKICKLGGDIGGVSTSDAYILTENCSLAFFGRQILNMIRKVNNFWINSEKSKMISCLLLSCSYFGLPDWRPTVMQRIIRESFSEVFLLWP